MKKYDVLVIGGGPAGISSAIYARRAGVSVCVFDMGQGKLEQAKKIANYYGICEISGSKLKKTGIKQAKALGVDVVLSEVVYAEKDYENDCFVLKTTTQQYVAKALIIATGEKQNKIDERLVKYQNQNISSCAICDGFFYKNKVVGVLGSGEYAFAEADILSKVARHVYVFANEDTKLKSLANIEVVPAKELEFLGQTKLEQVRVGEEQFEVDGLFVATGTMGALDIAKKLGVLVRDNYIVVDEKCKTNIKGVYSAGDITGGIKQIATAVYQGMVAGLESVKLK